MIMTVPRLEVSMLDVLRWAKLELGPGRGWGEDEKTRGDGAVSSE